MAETMPGSNGNTWEKPLGQFITALVLFTHAIVFFQLVVCSKNMVVAFNIPTKNIGIYVSKLSGMRSLLMSVGGAFEYGFHKATSSFSIKDLRKYVSITSFTCLTITRFIFLIFLYYPETVSFRNYIVLIIGAFFVGSFQISAFSLAPHVSALSWLSVYLSGIFAFVVQAIMDMCWSKRPSLTFKIQSWIALILSIISIGSWAFNLFGIEKNKSEQAKNCNGTHGAQVSAPGVGSGSPGAVPGTPAAPAPTSPKEPQTKIEYLISMSSISILKIMTHKLNDLCSHLASQDIVNVQILVRRLEQITIERDITYEVLVAIDLVILNLKRCSCSRAELILLAELSLFLRIKVLVKTETDVMTVSHDYPGIYAHGALPVHNLLYEYPGYGYPYNYEQRVESIVRAKRSPPGEQQKLRRVRRNANGTCQNGVTQSNSNGQTSIYYSISPFLMFGAGSLLKDFLFPGVIPYGLLERDKCHLINLIVIIFLSVGPVTIYVMDISITEFKSNHMYYHGFWGCMIPKILIFTISLCAIHTKQGCTHQIRSSRWRVFLMTMILLTCYGFLETVNIVGVPNIARKTFPDLIAINNIFGKFVRYFVYKLSVGYNKTRINAGYVLPNFKPPEPIPDTFCYWFKGAFSNGWKDIKGDFKMGITQYLAVDQTVSKKSPLESLRYCDLLM